MFDERRRGEADLSAEISLPGSDGWTLLMSDGCVSSDGLVN